MICAHEGAKAGAAAGDGPGRRDAAGPDPAARATEIPRLPRRDAAPVRARDRKLRLRQARRDDPHARWGQAPHRHPHPEGRPGRADPAHAHALRRQGADESRAERAPRSDPERLRQRDRGDRRGRLHPRRPGRARQARIRGRLRDEPPAAWAAEPDAGRPLDRLVRHHRLAGEERSREQRPRGHPRNLLRRLPSADGARQPASGAQGGRADEPDGGRLDGGRLVPQRRLPAADDGLRLRPGGDRQVGSEVVDEPLRRLRPVHAGRFGG